MIERVLLIYSTDVITPEALMEIGVADVWRPRAGDDVTLRRLEREHLQGVMTRAGDLNAAAAILGVSKSTLWRRRMQYECESATGVDGREAK